MRIWCATIPVLICAALAINVIVPRAPTLNGIRCCPFAAHCIIYLKEKVNKILGCVSRKEGGK
jgi:hypothetical protein